MGNITPNIFSSSATKKWQKYTHTQGGGHIYGKKITVNMPTLKSSLIKPSKSMLFFHIWNANFSVTPINSQMYMTKPKQVQKKLSENTGKTFSVIMPSFTCRGGHIYGNYCTVSCFIYIALDCAGLFFWQTRVAFVSTHSVLDLISYPQWRPC